MATLTTTITEALTLNGKDQGGVTSESSSTSVVQSWKRIVNVPVDTRTTLLGFHSTGTDQLFDEDSVQYIRITNLNSSDDDLELVISNDSDESFAVQIPANKSFMFPKCAFTVQASTITDGELDSGLTYQVAGTIYAYFADAAGDVEIFVASNAKT